MNESMNEIFERYLDGSLDEDACGDLLRRIDLHPGLLDDLLQQVRLDAELNEILTNREQSVSLPLLHSYASAKSNYLDELCRLSQMSQESSSCPDVRSNVSPRPTASKSKNAPKNIKAFSPNRGIPVFFLFVLAICLSTWGVLCVLEITGKSWQQLVGTQVAEEEKSGVLATITETSDPIWGRGTAAYRRGEPLFGGSMTLLSGLFSMKLCDGTQVIVDSGTEFSIDSKDKITCRNGKMTFSVPSRSEKMTVALPQCDVVVLGTKFDIETSNLHSDIHLIEGRIMLTGFRNEPDRKEYVNPGEMFRIDSRFEIRRLPVDSKRWVSPEEMRRLDLQSQEREREHWKTSRETRTDDGALLVAVDFEDQTALVGDPSSMTVLAIGGKPAEGRFPDKKAMLFSEPQDRIELRGSARLEAVTVTASIRFDRFDESSSTLFFSQKNIKGAAFWQILPNGQIVFGGTNQNRSRSFRNPIPIVREQLGTWFHLAIVIDPDQRRVTHYFNGRPVGTERISEPLQIRIDDATIGRRPDDMQRRSFNGCIDEFRIYSRCLEPNEILAIVEGQL